jgi:hypothetical protein
MHHFVGVQLETPIAILHEPQQAVCKCLLDGIVISPGMLLENNPGLFPGPPHQFRIRAVVRIALANEIAVHDGQ